MKDVDLGNNLISLQVTKNRKARYIPIPPTLNKVLTEYILFRQVTVRKIICFVISMGK